MTQRSKLLPLQKSSKWGRGLATAAPEASASRSLDAADRDTPLLIDSREVARLLGIGRTKAFTLMARNELPVVRIGRCVRVSRPALVEWINEHAGR